MSGILPDLNTQYEIHTIHAPIDTAASTRLALPVPVGSENVDRKKVKNFIISPKERQTV